VNSGTVPCSFTLAHYEDICSMIGDCGYRAAFFDEVAGLAEEERVVLLRHDLDQSLEQALRVARIEHDHGLRSTFFVWLTSPFYNVLDPTQSAIVRELAALGHQVGLHFDETAYALEPCDELSAPVRREVELLSDFLGLDVRVVSFHRPSERVLRDDVRLPGLSNTYEARFVREFKYISDSRRTWREGCACTKLASRLHPKLHLLTHPFWWTERESASVDDRGRAFLGEKLAYLDARLRRNISVYRGANVPGKDETP
jgi:hypothetical protein